MHDTKAIKRRLSRALCVIFLVGACFQLYAPFCVRRLLYDDRRRGARVSLVTLFVGLVPVA